MDFPESESSLSLKHSKRYSKPITTSLTALSITTSSSTLLFAIEPIRNTAHYALRKAFRNTTLEALKTLKENFIVIFTAALSTSPLPTPYAITQLAEYMELAEARAVPLVVINIICDFGVNSGRLCGIERNEEVGGKTKLVDIEVLGKIRRETSLLDRQQVLACGKKRKGSVFYFRIGHFGFSH